MSKIEINTFRYSYFIETENYLFFLKGIYNNQIKHIVFDKNSRISFSPYYESKNKNLSLNAGFLNDIDGGYPFLPFDALKDGRLYCTFYPHELKNLIAQNTYDQIEIKDMGRPENSRGYGEIFFMTLLKSFAYNK